MCINTMTLGAHVYIQWHLCTYTITHVYIRWHMCTYNDTWSMYTYNGTCIHTMTLGAHVYIRWHMCTYNDTCVIVCTHVSLYVHMCTYNDTCVHCTYNDTWSMRTCTRQAVNAHCTWIISTADRSLWTLTCNCCPSIRWATVEDSSNISSQLGYEFTCREMQWLSALHTIQHRLWLLSHYTAYCPSFLLHFLCQFLLSSLLL